MPLSRLTGGHYAFGPAVRLRVSGSALARSYFEREYGPATAPVVPADVEADVRFGRRPAGWQAAGQHKTARWRIAFSDPQERPLRVEIGLTGGPPSFALSLVQGYYVEPLIAVASARAGFVALPSVAVLEGAGAIVIIGGSGSGKSSVAVRALAGGRGILGDDQVLIAADGHCWSYPRRLRLYPDVRCTAPQAWRRLRPSTRRTLRLRRAIRWSTRGFVAPSLPVPVSELSAPVPPPQEGVRATRLVVLEHSPDVDVLTEEERDAGWAAREAAEVIAAQRRRFAAAAGARWTAALHDAGQREAEVVRSWLEPLPIAQLRVPRAWDAPAAVLALAQHLGTDR
jgi:hypothetical protein